MIRVTKLNKQPVVINVELIKFIESTPDTLITMTTGDKIMVRESLEDVVSLAIDFGRRVRCFSVPAVDDMQGAADEAQ